MVKCEACINIKLCPSSSHFANSSSFVEEDVDDDDFGSNLVPKTEPLNDDSRLTTEVSIDNMSCPLLVYHII